MGIGGGERTGGLPLFLGFSGGGGIAAVAAAAAPGTAPTNEAISRCISALNACVKRCDGRFETLGNALELGIDDGDAESGTFCGNCGNEGIC